MSKVNIAEIAINIPDNLVCSFEALYHETDWREQPTFPVLDRDKMIEDINAHLQWENIMWTPEACANFRRIADWLKLQAA